jgi:uridine kinase
VIRKAAAQQSMPSRDDCVGAPEAAQLASRPAATIGSAPKTPMIEDIAEHLVVLKPDDVLRVAVDGVDGVGKTTFADRLATAIVRSGRRVIRASVDDFHNAREVRYRRGRSSPEGFYLDSYNYTALREYLLEPLGDGGSRLYRGAVFDLATDSPLTADEQVAPLGSILIFDGIFLHRPELLAYWHFSIFLEAPFEVTIPRGAARGPGFGSPDPASPSNRRYVEGQKIYLGQVRPRELANLIIDNSDLSGPVITAWRA